MDKSYFGQKSESVRDASIVRLRPGSKVVVTQSMEINGKRTKPGKAGVILSREYFEDRDAEREKNSVCVLVRSNVNGEVVPTVVVVKCGDICPTTCSADDYRFPVESEAPSAPRPARKKRERSESSSSNTSSKKRRNAEKKTKDRKRRSRSDDDDENDEEQGSSKRVRVETKEEEEEEEEEEEDLGEPANPEDLVENCIVRVLRTDYTKRRMSHLIGNTGTILNTFVQRKVKYIRVLPIGQSGRKFAIPAHSVSIISKPEPSVEKLDAEKDSPSEDTKEKVIVKRGDVELVKQSEPYPVLSDIDPDDWEGVHVRVKKSDNRHGLVECKVLTSGNGWVQLSVDKDPSTSIAKRAYELEVLYLPRGVEINTSKTKSMRSRSSSNKKKKASSQSSSRSTMRNGTHVENNNEKEEGQNSGNGDSITSRLRRVRRPPSRHSNGNTSTSSSNAIAESRQRYSRGMKIVIGDGVYEGVEAEVTRIRRVSIIAKFVRKGETKPRSGVLRFEQIQGDKLFGTNKTNGGGKTSDLVGRAVRRVRAFKSYPSK